MKAAVLEGIGKPLRVVEIPLGVRDLVLEPGQVFVRVLTSGICGSQLQEIDGIKGDPSHCPHLLGHEGCGINHFTQKKVVVHWRKGEGKDPKPVVFKERSSMHPYGSISGGYFERDIKSGPCTTFSTVTVVSENRITEIPSDVPDDLAALLGCCLSTALATMENVAEIEGKSVLIIGCGGVGLAMILSAKSLGASHIVATDREFSKWKLSKEIGADRFFPAYTEFHWIDFSNHTDHRAVDPVPKVEFDVIIDTIGAMTRTHLLKKDGRHIVMTGPNQNTQAGDFNPTKDIPRYIQMWREGKLDGWEKIITHRIKLNQINEGIELMRSGKAGRVMIDFT